MEDYHRKSSMIKLIKKRMNSSELLECARKLAIDETDFYNSNLTMSSLAENFVGRVYQLQKDNELETYLTTKNIRSTTSDRSAESFGRLLNVILEEFDKSDKLKDFEESELFEPMEFEDKMRKKAKLSEDIIQAGIRIKPDIVVLRKKAKALNYKNYEKLIQKLARYYKYNICSEYPVNTVSSSERFTRLYKAIESIIPDKLYNEIEDIEMNIEGLIYDTISKCLIFNE